MKQLLFYSFIFFHLVLFLGNTTCKAQNVDIPDVNFKAVLVGNTIINTNNDGEIQMSEAAAFNGEIYAGNINISDMTGIESFVNITQLHCNRNQITHLDIHINTALEFLDCSDNKLTTLDVSANIKLFGLYCSSNQLTALDVSDNINFDRLECNWNQIKVLDVSFNPLLSSLDCSNNQIKNLNVSDNIALVLLYCSFNQLTALDVSANADLKILDCNYNQITILDVSSCKSMDHLNCEHNNLKILNLKNGSTSTLRWWYFRATNNPNLNCIQVNNAADAARIGYDQIDQRSRFSEWCPGLETMNNSLAQVAISIIPNPTNGIFTITGLPSENLIIELYNMAGKKVYSEICQQKSHRVDISGCTKGIYVVNMFNGKKTFTDKIEIK